MKKIILFSICITFYASSKAQRIRVGEQVPEVEMNATINNLDSTLHLSQFKNDLTILFFWGTGCSSSTSRLRLLDTLQHSFEGKIQFLAIGNVGNDSLRKFFKKRPQLQPKIPVVHKSKQLESYFPKRGVPNLVWLDRNKKVIHITSNFALTSQNLAGTLNGENMNIHDINLIEDYDQDLPLIAEGNGRWLPKIPYYSFISNCIPDLPVLSRIPHAIDSFPFLSSNCSPILELLLIAFSENGRYNFANSNALILDVKDPARYQYPSSFDNYEKWAIQNNYSYVIRVPNKRFPEIYSLMQNDLKSYFGLDARIIRKKIKCLVLVKTSGWKKLKSKGGVPTQSSKFKGDTSYYIKNTSIAHLAKTISNRVVYKKLNTPLVDGTGINFPIDIELSYWPLIYFELPVVRKELQSQGLDLVEKMHETDVLYIKEK